MLKRGGNTSAREISTRKQHRVAGIWVLLLLLFLPTSVVLANSLPPPFQIYLRFFSASTPIHSISGVQLVGCDDSACSSPQNMVQFGDCSASGFLTTAPLLADNWKLECSGPRCLFESDFHEIKMLPPYIQLIIQYDADVRQSTVIKTPDCDYCTIAWKVDLGALEATISLDEEFIKPDRAFRSFFPAYLFTILIEVLAAVIFAAIFRKSLALSTRSLAISTLLANLLSYPISWLVIPAFGQFQADFYRKVSIMIIAVVAIATLVSLYLQKNRGKIKKGTLIAMVIAVPVCAVLFLIGMFISSYGNYTVHVSGLPWVTVVILAEIFAVGFESIILTLLLNDKFPYHKALLFSLFANAASFLLGLLLFP